MPCLPTINGRPVLLTPVDVTKFRNHLNHNNPCASPKGPDSAKAWKLGNGSRPTAKPTNERTEESEGVSHLKFARKHDV